MSNWRSELKSSGYYYYDHRNDNCWYLIASFFDDVMNIRPSTLINLKVPNSVYLLIINDIAHLAINDPYDFDSKEYARYLLAFMEHPSKGYNKKYYFDYKAYTDDLILREQRIEEAKKAERIRLRKEREAKRKEILERQIHIIESSSPNNIIMSDMQILQKYAITENMAIQIAELKEREKKRQILLKSKQERFNQILRKFISETKRNNSIDLKAFAMQNNFDLNEVLEVANLSELIGLTEIIEEKRTWSELK